ncbi:glycosyl transferase family protein [Chondrocystis sp. NIES-4102]|nr:glycosyl transferase family protein [Chondrocystis sp. NIES-4102]
MFKRFQNSIPPQGSSNSPKAIAPSDSGNFSQDILSTQQAQADSLWEQGKLNEALSLYAKALKENPQVLELQQRLAERLKQQIDLAIAYEKLATNLKKQGDIQQAANYYRQAINLKSLTSNTTKLLKAQVTQISRSIVPVADLKQAAFSFVPLTSINSAIALKSASQTIDVEPSNISPSFAQRLKPINPQQAKNIDWETGQVYLQLALDHLEKQEWEKAALACKQATQILPDMAEAYKIWGNALQRLGRTAEAMSCYTKAVEIKPNLAEVYAGIGNLYANQQKWHAAITHYQKAIIIKPSAEIYNSLAGAWQQLGDTEKAQFNLYQAEEIKLSSNTSSRSKTDSELNAVTVEEVNLESSVNSYRRIAQKLEQDNQWQKAAQYYRKALDLSITHPKLPPGEKSMLQQPPNKQIQLSLISMDAPDEQTTQPVGQLDKAIKRYYKQSKLQPNSPKIHTDLGNLYAKKRKWQYAIACYTKAIELNPRYANAHLSMARVLLKMGKQKEFVREMQLAIAIDPKIGSEMDRYYLGNALLDQGQHQQAISFYYKAILLNPKFIQTYHRLSEILSKRGQHQEAIQFLERGIYFNPDDAESYYFLGQQWEQLQNWERAVKIYSKVLQIEPQYPGALQRLNHALAEKLKLQLQTKK